MATKTKARRSTAKGARMLKTIAKGKPRIKVGKVRVEDVARALSPDVVAQAAKRSEEISKSARVTQSDLQLQVSM